MLLAGQTDSEAAYDALANLCKTYWYPLYVFVRRQGQDPENAKDLVQGFFARLLEKNYIKGADREKGKFRSFLLIALKRFMADEWDRANRLKRGGGHAFVSLDEQDTEMRFKNEPADDLSPEKAFNRRWAQTLLEQVSKALEAELRAASKGTLFDELKAFISGERGSQTYAEIGQQLGMTEANVKVNVHRMRQRYRELLRLEIAKTVDRPEAVDEEIQNLFSSLG